MHRLIPAPHTARSTVSISFEGSASDVISPSLARGGGRRLDAYSDGIDADRDGDGDGDGDGGDGSVSARVPITVLPLDSADDLTHRTLYMALGTYDTPGREFGLYEGGVRVEPNEGMLSYVMQRFDARLVVREVAVVHDAAVRPLALEVFFEARRGGLSHISDVVVVRPEATVLGLLQRAICVLNCPLRAQVSLFILNVCVCVCVCCVCVCVWSYSSIRLVNLTPPHFAPHAQSFCLQRSRLLVMDAHIRQGYSLPEEGQPPHALLRCLPVSWVRRRLFFLFV